MATIVRCTDTRPASKSTSPQRSPSTSPRRMPVVATRWIAGHSRYPRSYAGSARSPLRSRRPAYSRTGDAVSADEPGGLVADAAATAGIPERSAEDLMDVEHRLRGEASPVAAAVVEERLLKGVKIRSTHAVQRDVADEWVDVAEDLALVAAERGRAKARPASRQRGPGRVSRHGRHGRGRLGLVCCVPGRVRRAVARLPGGSCRLASSSAVACGSAVGALVHDGVVPAALLDQASPHVCLLAVGAAHDRCNDPVEAPLEGRRSPRSAACDRSATRRGACSALRANHGDTGANPQRRGGTRR